LYFIQIVTVSASGDDVNFFVWKQYSLYVLRGKKSQLDISPEWRTSTGFIKPLFMWDVKKIDDIGKNN